MKLQEIKEQYAKEKEYPNWNEFREDLHTHGKRIIEYHYEQIAERYRSEGLKEASEKIENIKKESESKENEDDGEGLVKFGETNGYSSLLNIINSLIPNNKQFNP